ncbi:MAG: VacJ family lipoprotein [Pseudomonadota bacterium]
MLNLPLIVLASPSMAVAPAAAADVAAPTIAVEAAVFTQATPISKPAPAPVAVLDITWSMAAAQNTTPEPGPGQEQAAQQSENSQDNEDVEGESESEGQGGATGDENVITVTGTYGPPKEDPLARVNEESYKITQQLDEVFVEPVAYAYRDGLPDPIRDGLGNVVKNLGEPNNALNFLLQGKIGKTFETLGRLAINSTLGLGGLIDIAEKPGIGLPHRRNGFANTMGFYGVGPGPYLYLPLTGATTARDVVGSGLDQLLLPVAIGEPFNRLEFTVPFYVISNLDARLEVDEELDRIGETIDPYRARRDSYLYRRAKTIAELRGEEPPEPPLIMEEVEGTGDFADPPEVETETDPEAGELPEPLAAVIITRLR